MEDELEAHIEMAVEDQVRNGLSPEEARRVALMKLGGRLSARERAHDQGGLPDLESWCADVRYAFRALRKSPGFTAVAVTMLGLGIGANAAVFTVTKAALFAGFPLVAQNDRLITRSWAAAIQPHARSAPARARRAG